MVTFNDFAHILKHHVSDDDWSAIKDLPIKEFVSDSRLVKNGEVFVLLSINSDIKDKAKSYIQNIQGTAVLSELSASDMGIDQCAIPIVHIANLRLILGDLIKAYLQTQQKVKLPEVLAVTGTNGKTTISQLTAQLCQLSGRSSAIMGTAGNGKLEQLVQSSHTTSEVIKVQEFLHQMARDGVQVVSLEASSHGLHQHRLQGVPISVAIFSNLTRDHLDYHANMDEYGATKAKLFEKTYFTNLHHAIINGDDEFGLKLAHSLKNQDNLTVWTYSLTDSTADFFAQDITPSLQGVDFILHSPFGQVMLTSPLLGLFNVGNLLASIAGFLALYPDDFDKLSSIVKELVGARGRMQKVPTEQGLFIVDYAHTPDALTQVLKSLKAHCLGDLWAVFGCGGDRDKGKRPLMAKVGVELADKVILTADNPRSEDVLSILKDMQEGLTGQEHDKTIIEPDRKQAIDYAVKNAKAGDIVVIAGKGHETYQEIKGVRYDFDDVAMVQSLITDTSTPSS